MAPSWFCLQLYGEVMKANHLPASRTHPAQVLLLPHSPSHTCSPHSSCWFLPVRLPPAQDKHAKSVTSQKTLRNLILFNPSSRAPLVPAHVNPPQSMLSKALTPLQLLSPPALSLPWKLELDEVYGWRWAVHSFK
ncbi:hypothetical protein HJG60_010143 [Phyllostomus discolor]|uniref:Uncharacterized protein n=1 Tax=Phyllostomus discolor TaxID=89673 RepID=A0A834EG56_9CHIR|nr:hypothetical protein HJG60_010143 [Phyllostomus discolor]